MGANHSSPEKSNRRTRQKPDVSADVVRGYRKDTPGATKQNPSQETQTSKGWLTERDLAYQHQTKQHNQTDKFGSDTRLYADRDSERASRIQPDEPPAIIKRATDGSKQEINTIKQAKVNVRDKISFFKEAPVVTDRNSKYTAAYRRSSADVTPNMEDLIQHSTPIPILPLADDKSRTENLSAEGHKYKQEEKTPGGETESASKNTEQRKNSGGVVLISHKKSSTAADILDTPEIDYDTGLPNDNDIDGGWTDTGKRMNTLEYFKHVPRDNSILRGFEKAKPARARHRKAPAAGQHSKLPRNGTRPVSMFSPTQPLYGSDTDLGGIESDQSVASNELADFRLTEQDKLASTNKHGQRYAMDDTAYETLSRKKKIAGQRLAVGVIDKQTEKNFLLSLKRNLQLRHAKDSDDNHQERISDVMF